MLPKKSELCSYQPEGVHLPFSTHLIWALSASFPCPGMYTSARFLPFSNFLMATDLLGPTGLGPGVGRAGGECWGQGQEGRVAMQNTVISPLPWKYDAAMCVTVCLQGLQFHKQ